MIYKRNQTLCILCIISHSLLQNDVKIIVLPSPLYDFRGYISIIGIIKLDFITCYKRTFIRKKNQNTTDSATMSLRQAFARFDTRLQSRMSSKMKDRWNHPAGFKTIHFWAPAFKWALVIAGLSDYFRPPEKLSLNQSASLMATGFIWSRYSLVIIPKNFLLFSVNIALGITGATQVYRVLQYRKSLEAQNNAED